VTALYLLDLEKYRLPLCPGGSVSLEDLERRSGNSIESGPGDSARFLRQVFSVILERFRSLPAASRITMPTPTACLNTRWR
jgi:hypothetical protein